MRARVVVEMDRCAGHGMCLLLLPDQVRLDRWGFPVLAPQPLRERRQVRNAKRAARACPRRAIRV